MGLKEGKKRNIKLKREREREAVDKDDVREGEVTGTRHGTRDKGTGRWEN